MVELVVFCGIDEATGFKVRKSAFDHGFLKEACLNAWSNVGAAPLTRNCLSNPKVSKTLGDSDSNFNEYLISIQVANDLACID